MIVATYGALLVTGFLGSLGHCLGMCGPLLSMVGVRIAAGGAPGRLARHVLYHAARVMTYGALGAIAGALGSFLRLHSYLSRASGVFSVLGGVAVVLFALGYLGWVRLGKMDGLGDWIGRAMSAALKERGYGGVALLGMLNGLLPCCLVYPALLAAAATGGVVPAMASMLFFGIGTVPALLVVGMGAGAFGIRTRQALDRAARAMIVVVGVQLVLRGLAGMGILASQQLGPVVLW